MYQNIQLQIDFRKKLFNLSLKMKENRKDKFQSKKENLRRLIVAEGGPFDMRKMDPPRPCPIKPNILLKGVEPTSSTLF